MKYTSAEASKLLKKLNTELQFVLEQEQNLATFIAATTENVEDCRPEYNYEETRKQVAEIQKKIRTVKHAINVFNVTTVVPGFEMTIDEMLVYIPELKNITEVLRGMAQTQKRERDNSADYVDRIDYKYANFDVLKAKADFSKYSELLSDAQLALDKLNNTVTFEINI